LLLNTIKPKDQVKEDNLSPIVSESEENKSSVILKKSTSRRRLKGACGYTEGNKTAFLNVVEELLSSIKEEWEKVASCFNTQWTKHFCHFTQTAKGLKTKFQELIYSLLISGGKRSLFEQKALHCKKLI
jgi:hypothetical protein